MDLISMSIFKCTEKVILCRESNICVNSRDIPSVMRSMDSLNVNTHTNSLSGNLTSVKFRGFQYNSRAAEALSSEGRTIVEAARHYMTSRRVAEFLEAPTVRVSIKQEGGTRGQR